MSRARIRRLLATTAVAAVFAYGLSGHGSPQMSTHDGMADAAAGLCLLLMAVLTYAGMPKPNTVGAAIATSVARLYTGPPPRMPLDARARASPSTLQRFRN